MDRISAQFSNIGVATVCRNKWQAPRFRGLPSRDNAASTWPRMRPIASPRGVSRAVLKGLEGKNCSRGFATRVEGIAARHLIEESRQLRFGVGRNNFRTT